MSNFNDLLDASVDLGQAWAARHSRRPQQPAVVLESQYIELYETLKRIAAQRDEIAAQRDLYRDAVVPFFGQVLNKDELNACFRRLAKERGIEVT